MTPFDSRDSGLCFHFAEWFKDDDTLLVNDYMYEFKYFKKAFDKAIEETGLNVIVIPYNPYGNKGDDAKGI